MKKQGPPAPLDETKITMLKKRKAEPEADAETNSGAGKRRRKGDGGEKSKNNVDINGTVNGQGKHAVHGKPTKEGKQKKVNLAESDNEVEDEEASGLSEVGVEDEFDELDGISDEDAEGQAELDSILDSEDEDNPRAAMFSDDEDDSDAEERITAANIEGLSNRLDSQQHAEQEDAERELKESAMQTNIAGDRPDVFASVGQDAIAPDLQLLRSRITETIRILGNLKTLGQPDKSRTDYIDLLIKDICQYYGYTPFMAEKLFSLFTPMEAFAFFEANETARPVVIRTNTLRTNRRSLAQALINRGVVLEPLGKWTKVGLQIFESAVPLGATPEYLAGHYILQAASSFLPVMALAPQPEERILDMAAAPGGKTTYMSALLRNTGCVIANDASKPRAKGLIGNIHRLGCKNTIVTNLDARTAFPKAIGGFDRVLLDAPCTGTGVISKDASVKTSKNEHDFLAVPHMQRQLLVAAVDSVDHSSKTGGYIVYSTCSVTVEENESVIQYILRKRPNVKIVDTGLGDFGSEGFSSYMGKQFDPNMRLTRRYFPHRENVDGFFVCKLKKTGPTPVAPTNGTASKGDDVPADKVVVDKTPIADEDGQTVELEGGAFGPFDDEDDAKQIAKAERRRIRRKGLDPKAVLNKPKGKKMEGLKQVESGGQSKSEDKQKSKESKQIEKDKKFGGKQKPDLGKSRKAKE